MKLPFRHCSGGALVLTLFSTKLSAEPAVSTEASAPVAPPTVSSYIAPAGKPDIPWLGVNATYYEKLKNDLIIWGVKSIRVNWGWHLADAPNDPHPRFYDDRKLIEFASAGFKLTTMLNPRGVDMDGRNMESADFEKWVANYKNYCRVAIRRFSSRGNVLIGSYLCGNETDLTEPSTGNLTPYQAVRFTRALWEAKNEINPEIVVESCPVSRPDAPYLREMIDLGVAKWCDVIGIHAYVDQMDDARFRAPWDYLRAVGAKKPISISESGAPLGTDWGPKALTDNAWRERWHALGYLQTKRFGYDRLMLFTYQGGDAWTNQWAYVDGDRKPIGTAYVEVKIGMTKRPLTNNSFEHPNDRRREWIPIQPLNAPDEPTWANFADVSAAHTGQRSLGIQNGLESRYVKRIVPDLKVGRTYEVSAWAKSPNGEAILAAQGFNRTDGLDERSARSGTMTDTTKGVGWKKLKVRFVPTNPWVVVSLGAAPAASGITNWDDVTVEPAS